MKRERSKSDRESGNGNGTSGKGKGKKGSDSDNGNGKNETSEKGKGKKGSDQGENDLSENRKENLTISDSEYENLSENEKKKSKIDLGKLKITGKEPRAKISKGRGSGKGNERGSESERGSFESERGSEPERDNMALLHDSCHSPFLNSNHSAEIDSDHSDHSPSNHSDHSPPFNNHSQSHSPSPSPSFSEKEYEQNISDREYEQNKTIGPYKIIKSIGRGSSGLVVMAINRISNEKVAIKIIDRKNKNKNFSEKRIYREAVISCLLNHPNINRLVDFIYSRKRIFLILEFIKGIQLYDAILKIRMSEEKSRKYFRQLVSAIDYLHKNSVVHRDLKIENVLIDHNDTLKLIDFGLSNFYDDKILLSTFCGSLYFAAPEVLGGTLYKGPEIDIWSLGIILYVMLCGKVPFDDENVQVIQSKIIEGKFTIDNNISKEAKDLLIRMLNPDSKRRITLEEIISSEWINKGYEDKVYSYMLGRTPLSKLNPEYVQALSEVLSFQFELVEEELGNFLETMKNNFGSLERIYWKNRPIIAMYYLLLEEKSYCSVVDDKRGSVSDKRGSVKRGSDGESDRESDRESDCDRDRISDSDRNSDRISGSESLPINTLPVNSINTLPVNSTHSTNRIPEIIRNFVTFVHGSKTKTNLRINEDEEYHPPWPLIKKSYFKGLFRGIRAKYIGMPNVLKKILMDLFVENEISYEITEKNYFCSFFDGGEESCFQIAMYYNVILSEYYVFPVLLNSRSKPYKKVVKMLGEELQKKFRRGGGMENVRSMKGSGREECIKGSDGKECIKGSDGKRRSVKEGSVCERESVKREKGLNDPLNVPVDSILPVKEGGGGENKIKKTMAVDEKKEKMVS